MEWNAENVHLLVEKQCKFFQTNTTLDLNWRINQLKKLKQVIVNNTDLIIQALHEDLGRDKVEAYICDVLPLISEVNEAIKLTKRWAKPETHLNNYKFFPALISKVYKMPYGVSLIISPFNFPFNLSIAPLIAAIAAGNTAVIKASSKSVASTNAMVKMFSENFNDEYIAVVDGGHDIADFCLNERFDKIFYTGSPNVGKHVLELASKNLTPVALELGGETGNWCIVRKDADIKDAARKIAFMKCSNSGQVCININQLAVAKEIAKPLLEEIKMQFKKMYGEDIINNPEYCKLIGKKAYTWCAEEADKYRDRIVFGGVGNEENLRYSPTLIYPVDINEDIVKHELFNPLLPVVEFEDDKIEDLLNVIEKREHGLALYLFTKNIKWAKCTMRKMQYGGGCVNEVFIHAVASGCPFNGTGHSGMGQYHGVWGFREFSHPSTCVFGKNKFNLNLREPPHGKRENSTLKLLGKKK